MMQPSLVRLQQLAGHSGQLKRLFAHYVRSAASSRFQGAWKSAFRGQGMEFDSVRPYALGDEVRHMDWRVTARTGKPHLKQFMEDRQRTIWLLVDDRPSLQFGTRGTFKHILLAELAALLGGATLAAGERLEALVVRPQGPQVELWRTHAHGRLRSLASLFALLCRQKATGAEKILRNGNRPLMVAMEVLLSLPAAKVGGKPKLFILSDWMDIRLNDEDAELAGWLERLARQMEVTLIQISDPADDRLPAAGWLKLVGRDGQVEPINLADPGLQQSWKLWAAARQQWVERQVTRLGIRHRRIYTTEQPEDALARLLQGRAPREGAAMQGQG